MRPIIYKFDHKGLLYTKKPKKLCLFAMPTLKWSNISYFDHYLEKQKNII